VTRGRWWLVLLLAILLVLAMGIIESARQPQPAQAQASENIVIVLAGDVSPPTNETKGDDHATAELIARINPAVVCLPGDVQYEYGHPAMFAAATGFDGSYGRLFKDKIACPAMGNHDVADPGPNAPGFTGYFADQLAALPCESDPNPCKPGEGYYVVDLPRSPSNPAPGWAVYVLNSNCQRAGGGTGDVQTPACGATSPQTQWLRDAFARRQATRKCSLMVWHHERWGTGFFGDDPAVRELWNVGHHFRNDMVGAGHSHSLARTGPMTPSGTLATTGAGQRQFTAGASGRSLTPNRVEPARVGTRERYNTKYGVLALNLFSTPNPDGTLGGTWHSQFRFVDGTMTAVASAGCWL
jgi:acid phosphatase type 7